MTTEMEENIEDYIIDFNTSSAISNISLKFLFLYIPILWTGGLLALPIWLMMLSQHAIVFFLLFTYYVFATVFIFIMGCLIGRWLDLFWNSRN